MLEALFKISCFFHSHDSSLCHLEVHGVFLKFLEMLALSFQLGKGRHS